MKSRYGRLSQSRFADVPSRGCHETPDCRETRAPPHALQPPIFRGAFIAAAGRCSARLCRNAARRRGSHQRRRTARGARSASRPSRIAVAEIPRHDQQRHAVHGAKRGTGVPQSVETIGGSILARSHASPIGRPCWAAAKGCRPPLGSVYCRRVRPRAAEQRRALLREHDMARPATLGLPIATVPLRVEIPHHEPGQFAVARTSLQCGLHERPEFRFRWR